MSIIETVAIFVGIPAAVVVVVAGLVYAGSARKTRRYRPGRPFDFAPVWFLSAADQFGTDGADGAVAEQRAVTGASRLALSKADTEAGLEGDNPTTGPAPHDATGGASARW